MKRLTHPNIVPPLTIEVAEDAVADYVAAGWISEESPKAPDTLKEKK